MYLIGEMTNIEVSRYSKYFTISNPRLLYNTFEDSMKLLNYVSENKSCIITKLTSENIFDIIRCFKEEEDVIRIIIELSRHAEGWICEGNIYKLYFKDDNNCINRAYFTLADSIWQAKRHAAEIGPSAEVLLLFTDEVEEFINKCQDTQAACRTCMLLLEIMNIDFNKI